MALHPKPSHNALGQDLMGLIDGDEVEKINDAPFNLEVGWRGVQESGQEGFLAIFTLKRLR